MKPLEYLNNRSRTANPITCGDCAQVWQYFCPFCKKSNGSLPVYDGFFRKDEVKPKKKKLTHKNFTAGWDKTTESPLLNNRGKSKPGGYKKSPKQRFGSPVPVQPTPIGESNYFVCSEGIFDEIKEVPEGFLFNFQSKKSTYYVSPDNTELVRVSDHWGWDIRFCAWHLKGRPKISSFNWKKEQGKGFLIGRIKFSDLKPNGRYHSNIF